MQTHFVEQDLRAGALFISGATLWLIPVVVPLPTALQGVCLLAAITSALASAAHCYTLADGEAHRAIWARARKQAVLSHASAWSLAQEDRYTQDYFFPTSPVSEVEAYEVAGEVGEVGEVSGEWVVTGSVKDKAWYRAIVQASLPTTTAILKQIWGITGGKTYGPASEYCQELLDRGKRENW